jgi:ribonuclease BN (tRNA processing enzyme)
MAGDPDPDRPGAAAGPGPTLTVLGCDGSYPGPGGAASGYLLRHRGTTLWLDAGAGTFANLQQVVDPGTVDAVVLSHEHPDHWSDVESFAVWALLNRRPREGGIPVYAPRGLRERSYFADHGSLAWRETEASERVVIGQLACTFSQTDHGPTTLAVRVDTTGDGPPDRPATGPGGDVSGEGATTARHSLVYSADSGAGWSAQELGDDIGTLLCEASYTREREGSFQHLSGRQAATMAADAGVRTLILTHRWPTVSADALAAEADDVFGRPVHQAATGRIFEW